MVDLLRFDGFGVYLAVLFCCFDAVCVVWVYIELGCLRCLFVSCLFGCCCNLLIGIGLRFAIVGGFSCGLCLMCFVCWGDLWFWY